MAFWYTFKVGFTDHRPAENWQFGPFMRDLSRASKAAWAYLEAMGLPVSYCSVENVVEAGEEHVEAHVGRIEPEADIHHAPEAGSTKDMIGEQRDRLKSYLHAPERTPEDDETNKPLDQGPSIPAEADQTPEKLVGFPEDWYAKPLELELGEEERHDG